MKKTTLLTAAIAIAASLSLNFTGCNTGGNTAMPVEKNLAYVVATGSDTYVNKSVSASDTSDNTRKLNITVNADDSSGNTVDITISEISTNDSQIVETPEYTFKGLTVSVQNDNDTYEITGKNLTNLVDNTVYAQFSGTYKKTDKLHSFTLSEDGVKDYPRFQNDFSNKIDFSKMEGYTYTISTAVSILPDSVTFKADSKIDLDSEEYSYTTQQAGNTTYIMTFTSGTTVIKQIVTFAEDMLTFTDQGYTFTAGTIDFTKLADKAFTNTTKISGMTATTTTLTLSDISYGILTKVYKASMTISIGTNSDSNSIAVKSTAPDYYEGTCNGEKIKITVKSENKIVITYSTIGTKTFTYSE